MKFQDIATTLKRFIYLFSFFLSFNYTRFKKFVFKIVFTKSRSSLTSKSLILNINKYSQPYVFYWKLNTTPKHDSKNKFKLTALNPFMFYLSRKLQLSNSRLFFRAMPGNILRGKSCSALSFSLIVILWKKYRHWTVERYIEFEKGNNLDSFENITKDL